MSDKPSYLGLLNAIAVGEARGFEVLRAWRDRTPDRELADVLDLVAIREREHAAAFTKRLAELGFQVRERPSEQFTEHLELAGSSAPDGEKFERILGYGDGSGGRDPLAEVFSDRTIDPATGALFGRFIAEERDSERRLRAVYDTVCAQREAQPPGSADGDDDVLHAIAERLDRLSHTLEELKTLRR